MSQNKGRVTIPTDLDVVKETDYDELKKTTNVYSINKYACYRPPGTKDIQFIEVYAS